MSSVIVGGIIALVSALTSALLTTFTGGRREWTFRARDERRIAYERFLDEVKPTWSLIDELYRYLVGDVPLGSSVMQEKSPNDEEHRREVRGLIDSIQKQREEVDGVLDRLVLVAGTPVLARAHGIPIPLSEVALALQRWLHGEDVVLWSLIPFHKSDNLRSKLVAAMRQDLAKPWLVQLHDRQARRWWRFWDHRTAK